MRPPIQRIVSAQMGPDVTRERRRNNVTPTTQSKHHEHALLQKEWKARYARLLVEGKSKDGKFPNCGNPEDRKKKKFHCLKCGVESYVRLSLFRTAPPKHIINCWKCKGSFLLVDIPKTLEKDAKEKAAKEEEKTDKSK